MIKSPESHAAVSAAAERYRAAGYQIVLEPSASLLPEVVRTFRPDFIATQGDQHIAVEVKPRSLLRHDEQLRMYAELFRNLPGWRFDLVVVPDGPVLPAEQRLLPEESLSKRLNGADTLTSEFNDIGGAILLLWTVIEASLRAKLGGDARTQTMAGARLVKEAFSFGLITQKEWKTLERLVDVRNQISHGEAPSRLTKAMYKGARSIASRLIDHGS